MGRDRTEMLLIAALIVAVLAMAGLTVWSWVSR